MPMEGNLLKRKMCEVEVEGVKRQDIQDIEFIEFTKHSKLVSELRQHILTYCSDATRFNYSQCSNFCNSEIQMSLYITEKSNGVMVRLAYNKRFRTRYVHRKFQFSENKKMLEHLMTYYKYVKSRNTVYIQVDVRNWPMGLMKLKHVKNMGGFEVTIYKSMCNAFIEDIKNNDLSGKWLCLLDCDEVSDRITIPAHFFKSVAFRTLENAALYLKSEIDSEDFINIKNEDVDLTTSISYDAIRAKVNKWNNETHENECSVIIQLPEDDNRVLDVLDIFPREQYDFHGLISHGNEDWKIGKVNVCVHSKSIYLYFSTD